jgi:hypothetical protein
MQEAAINIKPVLYSNTTVWRQKHKVPHVLYITYAQVKRRELSKNYTRIQFPKSLHKLKISLGEF